jgi:hypothetical protein
MDTSSATHEAAGHPARRSVTAAAPTGRLSAGSLPAPFLGLLLLILL